MKKYYDCDIYGRKNSIILSYKDQHLENVVVLASSKKEAREKAWNYFVNESQKFTPFMRRTDMRIEIEEA